MKITPGTNKKKDEKSASFTKETTGQPKEKANELKIPKSVMDNPGKHNLQHTVRKIHNGYIKSTSFNHDGDYQHHEVYYEKDPFGEVGGIDSK